MALIVEDPKSGGPSDDVDHIEAPGCREIVFDRSIGAFLRSGAGTLRDDDLGSGKIELRRRQSRGPGNFWSWSARRRLSKRP
jgi:hypothetical protein